MRPIYLLFFIIIIDTSSSCLNAKVNTAPECTTEYLNYYNYNGFTVLNEIKNISNLKEIDFKLFNFYLQNGVSVKELNAEQIISIPKNEFFNLPNLKGSMPMYVLGYYQNHNIKQYLVSDSEQNSSLYLVNEVKGKINSMLLVHSNYDTGFGSETASTKIFGENVFSISVYFTSDTKDANGKYSGRCNSKLKISNEGFLEPFVDINSDDK
ncbi:hypothetical protein [Chryseobacterium sp.]|uniref:hypothetical protein n=1 Tax=Chryseobacterium sp. TaxID=1871047 RepID=UPI0011CB45C8|nr:hypothetical protein [Chryseobacterium sp.]TXF79236.1 hypothetical protein FUA25_02240 [Chryseobacterium sp.]